MNFTAFLLQSRREGGVRRVRTYTQAPEVHLLLINDLKQSELILFFYPNSLIVKYT